MLTSSSFLTACTTREVFLVAHRGASHDAPENTLAAFRLAWQQGADAIEGDFYLSRDGHVVAFHDTTTQRTAGRDRKVEELTLEELRSLDVGSWKSPEWSSERAPTLKEVLACVPEGGKFFIEIKTTSKVVPHLKRDIESSSLRPEQVVIISFDDEVIAACKQAMPHIRAYWLHAFKLDEKTGRVNTTYEEAIATALRIQANGLDLKANEFITPELVAAMDRAGLELHVWTVNDPELARQMLGLGARSITTDRPAWLRDQLAARP